jgi:Putative addiction module component
MSAMEIKKELHDYIEGADDRFLRLIYGMILADKQEYEIPDWHKKIVEERLEDYERNPLNVISWEEVKTGVEKMR